MDQLLSPLYNDPQIGFIGAKKLYEKAKEIDSSIRLKDVKDWYSKQIDIQRFQDQKGSLPHFKITSNNPNSWQIDFVRNVSLKVSFICKMLACVDECENIQQNS